MAPMIKSKAPVVITDPLFIDAGATGGKVNAIRLAEYGESCMDAVAVSVSVVLVILYWSGPGLDPLRTGDTHPDCPDKNVLVAIPENSAICTLGKLLTGDNATVTVLMPAPADRILVDT